ncbi:PIN domain-like protein [Cladochytrium replicatum]|nr:PIN domain-like protein [Cladochytrium replicatum]
MGIKGLTKVIADVAPGAIKENSINSFSGYKVAVDASMSIYQFLIAVRSDGQQLVNESGETTSHLMGLFYRTIRMMENGIRVAYVFDGNPPALKKKELEKRGDRRAEAERAAADATEKGDTENMDKFARRTVRVTKEHNEECKRLLQLMGIPYVDAPCEAEAQCAALCKANKVNAAGSEDMDTLTFGSPVLMRHLTFSEARKQPINEIRLDKTLEGLNMTMDQFTDLCILLGCDYCDSIKGVGPKKAMQLIQEHGPLEKIVKVLGNSVPEDWPYQEARELFKNPDVVDPETIELKWTDPDVEGLVNYLVKEKNFSEERVRSGAAKLMKQRGQGLQKRLDGFFKPIPKDPSAAPTKRKAESKPSGPAKKKAATGAGRGRPRK